MGNICPQKVENDPIEVFCDYLVKDRILSNSLETPDLAESRLSRKSGAEFKIESCPNFVSIGSFGL
jgi:hypothetical protein